MFVVLALALALGAQPAQLDTVTLANGSVLRGTIVQDAPGGNLVIELESGESWTVPRSTVARVEYAPGHPPAPAVAPPREPAPPPPPPVLVAPAPGEAPPPGATPAAAPQAAAPPAAEEQRPPLVAFAVSTGLTIPVGKLDASGLDLSGTVSPMLTFGFEFGIRPVDPLEIGFLTVIGIGTAFGPVNDWCIEAGASCDASDLLLGGYLRVSPWPAAGVRPWIMAIGGWESLLLKNSYDDTIQFTGWQAGGALGVDVQLGGNVTLSFFAGGRVGEFDSVVTTGYIPPLWIDPALHGWVDLGVRA
ncbi:MAG TPA: hypothetical protein VFM45_13160, partial [Anaeromyxobacteraceae bacterium]|nr:hypothetical protein [Anaeromyxobacteraceae bacterium]